ncbi:acyl transferase domain-containing protein/pimeloyl-ACP methyl ester carboxylesterase/nucleoside-diphosphate-sugar epimerase/SAM-dependent methyltransferase [Saccharothrix tamanrassetensis]|uniref:Acyl transferase domain-containing protein/pimeloyl-ACP methyl ester carboxylesterase/nucleoside-diphosphate-sugar epimerase/SAM-dependent methyltransferase n=1 Tax=Saccharothrix tamanrassetensis TaxID=1051531 RepID=A0A841CA03_9PSEU|nr:SDR family NAD(P)-dependent oxidoreductase [Saccharothrix tamanrassetensis]MBB5953773.1 acyl transferase domain-containing protein/pimeloyl-ACP methyl ester carboxylesterase/nucleoside-diphosphate-sugar epimerase/SAM-dependent methyltransferase [Saccharothrix tamanrassetensis]
MAGIECRVRLTHTDFVMQNHRLHDVSVMPGVVFFDLVYRAAMAAGWDHRRLCVRDTVLAEAIVTTEGHDREVLVSIEDERDGVRPFTVRSRWLRGDEPASDWRDNAHGLVCFTDDPVPPPIDLDAVRAVAVHREDISVLYQRALREQIRHGSPMRCRGTLSTGGGQLLAELTREAPDPGFHLHPASLDATTLAGFGQVPMPTDDPFVPMFVRELRAPSPLPETCYVHVAQPERLAPSGDVITTDYTVRDAQGRFLVGFTGLTCKRIRESGQVHRLLPAPQTPPAPPAPVSTLPGSVSPNGLTDHLRAAVASMLGRPAADVATTTGFYDLGLDSVALLQLTNQLEDMVGTPLYPTLLFEHSTIDALAGHLSANHTVEIPVSDGAVCLVDEWVPQAVTPESTKDFLLVADAPPPGLTAAVPLATDLRALPSIPTAVVLVASDPATALWSLARQLVDLGPRDVFVVSTEHSAEHDAVGALARTMSAEVPSLRCRFLHVAEPGGIAAAVQAELGAPGVEHEVRHVGGRRLVRRWREVSPEDGDGLRRGGAYLITGGSGGLAGLLARHLVSRYDARVALMSRRAADSVPGAHVITADVTEPEAVRRAVAGTRERFGRIDGVFHCAGITRDGLFFRSAPDLDAVVAPKLAGLRNLHEAIAGDDVDFVAVFASASAAVPNPGQSAYAYANACVEHVQGQARTVVIGWPFWAEGGMNVPPEVIRRVAETTGQTPMPTATGFDLLPRLLASPHRTVLVLHGDRDRVRTLVPGVVDQSAGATAVEPVHAVEPAPVVAESTQAPVERPAEPTANEPIAVIGMAGRYPGAADLDEFWANLAAGRDGITEVPADRWDHDALYHPAKGTPGRTYGRWGGFIDGVDRFAPAFFGISRRDAERMDPQERLFLTTCHRTLEDAGYPPERLRGEVVGVYAGTMWNHYQLVEGAEDGVAPHAMHCSIANRVSHTFDLIGPSLAVDTACSSSLTAVHLAVESIRRGECTMALAGGVNVTVHPQKYLQLAQGQWLSVDGRCRAFGEGGTGYVPGEGVGALLLKPLSKAIADGDHVHGVIKATALNHTGRTAGATVPSPGSQAALIRRALAEAGWDPATVGYVEAHGTGTSLGDPIEVEGLRQAFEGSTGTCAIGSVKSNIGHLEGAAGVAGLTKVLLQFRHRRLVPSLHADELNPHIDFAATPFRVQRTVEPWHGEPRRAGVSAFGAGGTNAHVLLEEFVPAPRSSPREPALVVLSARTAEELRESAAAFARGLPRQSTVVGEAARLLGVPEQALDPSTTLGDLGLTPADLVELVGDPDGLSLETRLDEVPVDGGVLDIAYTAQVGRTAMPVRMALVVRGVVELRAALERFARGEQAGPDVVVDGAATGEDCVALFRAGRLHDVARQWVGGADVPWERCYPEARPHRVPLAGYPLPEERCWLGGWAGGNPAAAPTPVRQPVQEHVIEEHVVDGPELEFRVLDHGVALVAMKSPMFTAGLLDGLREVFAEIERREDVRAVVVTGSGSVFSMGGTPEALQTLAEGGGTFTDASFVYEGMLRCTRPVVTAASGHASGGGLAFACYGDVVVLAEEAVYSANFTKYGFTPGMGATYVLEQRFGAALSTEMLLTGRSLTGEELRRRGANVTVVPQDDVLPTALDLARSIADKPASAVRMLKDELAGRMLRKLPEIIASEVRMHERVLGEDSAALVRTHFAKVDGFRATGDTPAPTPEATRAPAPAPTPAPAHTEVSARIPVEVTAQVRATAPDRGEAGVDVAAVRAAIEQVLSAVLYLRPDEIGPESSFSDLGLDSIGAVELVRDLNRRFGTDLDSVAVYDHPTVPELAGEVLRAAGESVAMREQATADQASVRIEVTHKATTPESTVPLSMSTSSATPGSTPAEPATEPAELTLTVASAEPETPAVTVTLPTPESESSAVTVTLPTAETETPAVTVALPTSEREATTVTLRGPESDAPAATVTLRSPDPKPPNGDAIAVVGMAGRFPDAPDLDAFWRNLAAGHVAIREVPAERWDLTDHYDPDPAAPGRTYCRTAALLDDVDAFDAGLFRLSPLDAEAMDPQQRLFLEQAWAALEDAGHAGRPMRCGVFVGCAAGDYPRLLDQAGQGGTSEAFLGTSSSILPARIAYHLDLTGPTMAIDTACSSSLTAVHLACESIRSGECDTALAGGVAVMCTPQMQVWTSQAGMLSPTGRCVPFDTSADGIVLGEGVGVVVLKRLDQALADGDHVHGVILAGGINGDGRTNGITAPSAVSQTDLLRRVHDKANAKVNYVEAHGTGTALGDPIEVKALSRTVGDDCAVGSVKGNIGHTTMSAGIAGLLKVLLSLKHRQLPPTPRVENPIPGLRVVRELTEWTGPRVAGVSSFGFSGTNCHLVVAEAPVRQHRASTGHVVVPVSARTPTALGEQLDRLADHMERTAPDVHDVATTLTLGRAHLAVRRAFVAADTADLVRQLRGGAPDDTAPADLRKQADEWVAGGEASWPTDGRRVPLPAYPFARDRFWVGREGTELRLDPADPVVADHVLDGTPVLPGAAFLCLALGAGPARIGGVTWLRPVVVTQPRTLTFTADEQLTLKSDETHAVGWRRETAAPRATVDLAAIDARCTRPVADVYAAFARAGVHYGPSYRVLTDLRVGGDEAIATLTARPGDDTQIIDGAIQAIVALVPQDDTRPVVPFAVDSAQVDGPLPEQARVHVERRDAHRFDVTLTDLGGQVRARLDGVALRPLTARSGLLHVPVWRERPAPATEPDAGRLAVNPVANLAANPVVDTVVVHTAADAPLAKALCSIVPQPNAVTVRLGDLPQGEFDTVYVLARPDDPTAPAERDDSTLHAFRLVRHLLRHGAGRRRLTLTFVVAGAVAVDGEPVHPHSAGLVGLASALAAEYPEWSVTCVDVGVGDATALAGAIRRERGTDRLVALRGDRRMVRVLEPVADPTTAAPLRDGGVYLLVGGAGGIGFEVSRHLARTRRARLAWIGRSPEDDRIRGLAADVEASGGKVVYLRADVGDPEAVRRAVAEVHDRFGPVNGAFHTAITLRDRTVSTMDEEALVEVLRPKVTGVAVLADALKGEPLDFLALFSSALSFAPAPGQANYAAASAFEDSYGLALHRAGVPVRVVNWGYWGSVGVVARADYATRFEAMGIGSIEPADGIAALERVLAGDHPQVAVLKGTPAGLAELGVAARDDHARSSAGFRELDALARELLRDKALPAVTAPLRDAVAAAVAEPATNTSAEDVLCRYPDLAPHVELLLRCTDAVTGVLDGRTPPTEVLFPGGSTNLVAAVYRGQAVSDFYHRLLAEQVARAVRGAENPRVLEIGAGTGAGTAFALPAAGGAHYDYTDVSTAFLRQVEEEFPTATFRVLDIERDPAEQGFQVGSYDVVLATNVLHATEDVVRSLRHARSLLRPGGVLLVNEVTRQSDFLTATFGLLPGWWRFTDAHRRLPHSPLLSPAQWRAALAEVGLSTRIVGMPGVADDEQEQCVLVATPRVGQSRSAVRRYVREVFAEVLKFRPADLDETVTFENFGVDSLVSQRIVRRFEADLGELPATLLFEYLTIGDLADHLAAERSAELASVLAPAEPAAGTTAGTDSRRAVAETAPAQTSPAQIAPTQFAPEQIAPAPAVVTGPARVVERVPESDGIAVVGLTGRYPGARDVDEFWRNLVSGTSSITEVPPDRWDWREHFDPRKGRPQRSYSRWGGFLEDVDRFDPAFFGILPRDAAAIDPQERLFLETAWLLLEDAGYLGSARERDTGVFVGTMYGSYGRIAAAQGWPRGRFTDGHSAYWSIANRVSYALDLTGPSFAVDSACSSSLTAVHLACESLRRGECSMAIAGGVNLVLHPAHLIALSSMTMLAQDDACKVFDERADGFVPGEGVGAVLLKPLAAAVRDGDRIRGVIRGGFVNAGGKTAGYTVPNPSAQAELVVRALAAAGVAPGDVGYVEAHGTGTALGDPIEISGLRKALPDARCAIGSVKANIGHLEGAAGIAGLTKVLLQLEHGTIAPCANLDTVNPRIDLPPTFSLPTSATPWASPRLAGVSSFGAGGANAHLVVEEFSAVPREIPDQGEQVVLLSARTPAQLRTLASDVADFVEERSPSLASLAYTTQVGRAELAHRLAVVVSDVGELVRRLRSGDVVDGTVGAQSPERALFDGDDGAELVGGLLERRRLDKLAALWVLGVPVEWARLWPVRPERVTLPPYPFERQRLWLPEPVAEPWLTDHRVGGRRVLPGAASLAMVCAELGDRVVLRDVRWLAPVLPDDHSPRAELRDGVFSVTDGTTKFASGRYEQGSASSDVLDVMEVRRRCPGSADPADLYAGMRAAGLEHGERMRVLREVHVGDRECLALVDAADGALPLLLDGALQALAALPGPDTAQLPVGLGTLAVAGPLPTRAWVHAVETATGATRRFALRITDDQGRVVVSVDDLRVTAPTDGTSVAGTDDRHGTDIADDPSGTAVRDPEPSDPCVYLRPEWEPEPSPRTGPMPSRVRVLGTGPDFGGRVDEPAPDAVVVHLPVASGGLADEVGHALHDVLRAATAVLANDGGTRLRVVVACPDDRPAYVAVSAALRTLALEHSGFSGAVVRGTPQPDDLRHVDGKPEDRVTEVRYADGARSTRRLVSFEPPAPRRRTNGVYVIFGGSGAIGRHITAHLRATRDPEAVVVVGRDRADVTVESDVRRLVAEVKARYGRIDGVVHAAGVHDDARAVTKSAAGIDAVLAPKVRGVGHLAGALRDESLEFFVLFSSVAARTGNLGQVDYAYANAFLDEYAAATPGVVSICWPLWEDGGMRVDDATRELFARRWGSRPLGTAEALHAFDRAITAGEPIVAVVRPVESGRPRAAVVTGDLDTELRRLAAGFLLVDEREVDPDTAFLDLGFDSISLTELINQVNERFGTDLLPTVLYECPTLTAFADHLRAAVPVAEEEVVPVTVQPAADAIAVIGMAGVLPGSPDLDAFWRRLRAGEDLVRPVPEDRTDLRDNAATADVRAGFLDDVRSFDAAKFGISPREASLMDPQQRLFLQTAWQAVADAGYRPADLAGTETGLFVGVSACDYDDLLRDHDVPVEAHTASGLADCILANRVSYLFDLRGPSEAVDTACSSSLVAVHRAVRALLSGECEMALAGGVNVLLSPGLFVAFDSSGMLARDGRCKTFDADADGYGRGEGCGAVVLKPLSRALADGDQVIAVIRGSSVNHAGRGPSLTAPNPEAQARVVAQAYRTGDVDPARVSYIEAHGTGTRLGDPIEIEGLKKAFAGVDAEIAVGAVKTNIGHLEAAAGIAGLLKVLLAMRHGELPPTIHQHRPNPFLRLDGTPFRIVTEREPWTGPRVAGVSSFGFGGTNAHVVLESAAEQVAGVGTGPWRLVLSASSEAALAEYRQRVARFLMGGPDLDRVTYTLQTGREVLAHRFAAVVADHAEAVSVLLGDTDPVHDALTRSWLDGSDVDWATSWSVRPVRISAPAPPFARTPFWFDQLPKATAGKPVPMTVAAPAQVAPGKLVLRDPAVIRANGSSPASREFAPEPVVEAAPVASARVVKPSNGTPNRTSNETSTRTSNGTSNETSNGTSVAEVIRESVARVLGTEPGDIAAGSAFSDLGLDSIFRMELARTLMARFDVELTAAELYEHDTVDALVALISRSKSTVDALDPVDEPAESVAPERSAAPADSGGPVGEIVEPGDPVGGIVAEALDRPLDPDRSFADNGLTSFDMLRVIGALEQRYGALPKTLLFDRPTMAELTGFLSGQAGSAPAPAPVRRGTGDIETPGEVDGEPVVVRKRALADRPALRELMADLDRRYAKEGGLAGRDIAPFAFVDTPREGYVNFSTRGDDLFAWSFVGHPDHFHDLVADWMAWARRNGLRPNFLSLAHLTEVAGEPITATPFGAVQRLDDLSSFTTAGGRMQRLRNLLGRFERAGACRVDEYRVGEDPAVDLRIVGLMDSWGDHKQMVNPYVGVVREEIRTGRLDSRHRVFLTYVDDEMVNAIIVTKLPSERCYLLDLEFYPPTMPAGGLEYAIVKIIEKTKAEGCTAFSFGASFGVAIAKSPNADPEVAEALEELHSVGIFGEGNFRFKNKFRPTNTPIYLCRTAAEDRTSVTDIILMIANPDLFPDVTPPAPVAKAAGVAPERPAGRGTAARPVPVPPQAPVRAEVPVAAPVKAAGSPPDPTTEPGRSAILAGHGYNPLTLAHDLVPVDLLTDSWAERADAFIARRMRDLAERPAAPKLTAHDWLPFAEVLPTRSGRSAEAMLCRSRPGRRGVVLHTAVFPTWLLALTDVGYEPVQVGDGRTLDPGDIARAVDDRTAFVVVEASNNAGGGYPIGLDELREVRRITRERGVDLVLDASRIVENAMFLADGGDPWPVVREMLALADTATFSLSKDFGVGAGGLLATNDEALAARLREDVARRGWEVDLATRNVIANAVADRDGVAAQVRRRMAAVRALWSGLRDRGVPVVEPVAGHCVLLDVARMPAFAGQEHPVMSCLAWLYRGAGVRGAPHLSVGELSGCVRLAVPVGYGPAEVEPIADRIAELAAGGTAVELVTGGVRTAGEAARAVYQPVERVPEDVRRALSEGQKPSDDNEQVLREHRPDVRRHVVPAGGAEVEVFTAGEGSPLLLMHPFNIGAGVFAHQFAELADRHRVISIHHPGVGSTTAAPDITLAGLAALERDALHALGVTGPVHVVGASFGGLVALTYALDFPRDTASLTLLGSSYKIGNRVGEINRLAVVAAEDLDRTIGESGSERLARDRAGIEQLLLRCESMDPQIGLRYLDVFAARPDLLARLSEVDVPTMVVQGRSDTVIPLKTAHLLHGAITDARYTEIPDAGHFPYLTSPAQCNSVLAAFVAEHDTQEVPS